MTTFTTTLVQSGNNVGIDVPEEIVLGFGAGKRVPVTVTINGYTYSSTIAVMGGRYLVGVAAAHRAAAGVAGGEEHEVTIEHDTSPRTVEIPSDLDAALDGCRRARALRRAGLQRPQGARSLGGGREAGRDPAASRDEDHREAGRLRVRRPRSRASATPS